jgi:hypothetical protein
LENPFERQTELGGRPDGCFEKDHITWLSNLMKVLVETLTFLDRSPEKMFPGWKVATRLKVEIWNRMAS